MVTSPNAPRFLDYDKSLACIHCGLCLSSCPTYLETGNENDSPRGRIYIMRALEDKRLPLSAGPVRHIDLCLGCRACEAVCPSGVAYGELLEATREHIERNYRRSPAQAFLRRVLIEGIFPYPRRMKLALLGARLARALHLQKLLPGFMRASLELLPEHISAQPLPELLPATSLRQGQVGLISGCVMSVLFADTNAATARLVNKSGFDVMTPRAQGCCGALYSHGGNLEAARACARHNIEVFESLAPDAIIINAAGCGSTLKEYGHLLQDDPVWADRAARFSKKVTDLTEWLVRHPVPAAPGDVNERVTYHDACHLAHPQRTTQQPRQLVAQRAGANFVALTESDVCCGSAGSYNLTEPAMAARLQKRKVENILATGAQTVVTTNPGCILQIRAGLKAAGSNVRVVHIADYLDQF